jgi:hypothetical protein
LIDRLGPVGIRKLEARTERWRAVVVDQNVEASQRRCRLRDDPLAILGFADVTLDRDDLAADLLFDPRSGCGERRLAARSDRDAGTFQSELKGDCKSTAYLRRSLSHLASCRLSAHYLVPSRHVKSHPAR